MRIISSLVASGLMMRMEIAVAVDNGEISGRVVGVVLGVVEWRLI